MNKESGTREIELRDKCNKCNGEGAWLEQWSRKFLICDCCNGEGRISFSPTKQQIKKQKIWSKDQ